MIVANSCRCSKCKKLLSYEERIKITDYEFVADKQCHGSISRTLDSFNLCRECYADYTKFALSFFK